MGAMGIVRTASLAYGRWNRSRKARFAVRFARKHGACTVLLVGVNAEDGVRGVTNIVERTIAEMRPQDMVAAERPGRPAMSVHDSPARRPTRISSRQPVVRQPVRDSSVGYAGEELAATNHQPDLTIGAVRPMSRAISTATSLWPTAGTRTASAPA
jgi:hypothetical protein